MDELENKYDRFKQYLNETVRDEHRHMVDPLARLSVTDLMLIVRQSSADLATSRQVVMKAIGLTQGIIDSYDTVAVARIERYLEYFHTMAFVGVGRI